jgi:hypothetical protein
MTPATAARAAAQAAVAAAGVQRPMIPMRAVTAHSCRSSAFASGSDFIRVAVTSATSAQACGKMTLGEGTPPPPPTDPDVGYPPGYSTKDPNLNMVFFTIDRAEGFPLSIMAGTADAPRFTFGVDWREFWQSWCALQPPFELQQSAGFGCLGATGGVWSDMGCDAQIGDRYFPVECGRFQLCGMPMCTCTMTSCRVQPIARWSFDLRITDDQAAGSVRTDIGVADGEIHNVYLTRTK